MAVAVDAVSTTFSVGSSVTTLDAATLTIGASLSNGATVWGIAFSTDAVSAVAMHWDSAGSNQLMTALGSKNITVAGTGSVYLFGLRNPTSGPKNLHANWTTTAGSAILFGISLTGVDQTSDAAAFKNFISAASSSNSATVTVTSAIGDMVLGWFCNDPGINCNSVNNTQLYLDGAASNGIDSAANRAAGASSVAMTATLAAADDWAAIGIDIGAAAGAAAKGGTMTMMGAG